MDVECETDAYYGDIYKSHHMEVIHMSQDSWNKCIVLEENYVEEYNSFLAKKCFFRCQSRDFYSTHYPLEHFLLDSTRGIIFQEIHAWIHRQKFFLLITEIPLNMYLFVSSNILNWKMYFMHDWWKSKSFLNNWNDGLSFSLMRPIFLKISDLGKILILIF